LFVKWHIVEYVKENFVWNPPQELYRYL